MPVILRKAAALHLHHASSMTLTLPVDSRTAFDSGFLYRTAFLRIQIGGVGEGWKLPHVPKSFGDMRALDVSTSPPHIPPMEPLDYPTEPPRKSQFRAHPPCAVRNVRLLMGVMVYGIAGYPTSISRSGIPGNATDQHRLGVTTTRWRRLRISEPA